MTGRKDDRGDASQQRESAGRPVRADAQRSIDALLEAAREVFATSGVDAPVREIAKRAGVGIGTLYRNFPQRADLIAAVFRREIDACADAAPVLAGEHPPFEALAQWIRRYMTFLATKRGFAAALYSGDPAYEALPAYVRTRFEPALRQLLEAAITAGEVRGGVDPQELLRAIGSLSAMADSNGAEPARRMVDLLVDGLRHGANARQA